MLRKDSIKVTAVNTFNDIRSFEAMRLTLTYHGKSNILLVVYRLPPTRKNGTSVADFSHEFAYILDRYTTRPDKIVKVGDFNFHFDVLHDMHVRRFRDMLHCRGMTQHVQQPSIIKSAAL